MGDSARPVATATAASAAAAAAPQTSTTNTTTTTTTNTTSSSAASRQPEQPQPFVFTAAPAGTRISGSSTTSSGSSTSNPQHHARRLNRIPSKLPAFRFADLRKETSGLPTLQAPNPGIPPSPVSSSSDPSRDQALAAPKTPARKAGTPPKSSPESPPRPYHNTAAPPQSPAQREPRNPSWSRPATFHTPVRTATPAANPHRSISLDVSRRASQLADVSSVADSTSTVLPVDVLSRSRHPLSYSIDSTKRRARLSEDSQDSVPVDKNNNDDDDDDDTTKAWANGQRQLLLPKPVPRTDLHERPSVLSRRPPLSYKPHVLQSVNPAGASSRIPPIRTFRSPGDRSTLGIDMTFRSPTTYDDGYEVSDDRDRTLRALEGRRDSEAFQMAPLDSALHQPDPEDSGDVFLKMARNEPESAVSQIIRSAHRRPLSSIIPSYSTMSPPRAVRRMSEQDSPRTRFADIPSSERMARALNYPSVSSREQDEQKSRFNAGRSPMTPRSLTFQDPPADSTSSTSLHRRKPSIPEGSKSPLSHLSSLKTFGLSGARAYNSSPLVPKSADATKQPDQSDHHTESSASTAAPSTVWDELDDLKSRIRRLELTGKLPATSGAAVSRSPDERPPTATTNATTMSASPKRGTGAAAQPVDAAATVSSAQKDIVAAQPLLQSAMKKSHPFLSPDVYRALEAAANDAMALSTMIGQVGQPGPVSSAASTVGAATGVTDRQLRRKAEGICRSLTELCLALGENAAKAKPQEKQEGDAPAPPKQLAGSPTIMRSSGTTSPRRLSTTLVISDRSPLSPRTGTRLEQKRTSMLMSSTLPSPTIRFTPSVPSTPIDVAGRRTSLLIPRTRRAVTEEPDEQAATSGRKSSMLRTRRSGTEEPEDSTGRRSSLRLLRTRRGTVDPEDGEQPQSRFRSTRTIHEASPIRPPTTGEFNPQIPLPSIETTTLGASALPRRRLGTPASTRIVPPTPSGSLATRRYLERSSTDREAPSAAEKPAEERATRSFAMNPGSLPGRTGSLNKRTKLTTSR